VQYPKINTFVHKKNSIPCQLGDDFVLSRPTMWMKKRESFYGAFIQKKNMYMCKKKIILVN
jgi:hypothetical protein